MSTYEIEEIRMWNNVEYVDLAVQIFNLPSDGKVDLEANLGIIELTLLDLMSKKYGQIIKMRSDLTFGSKVGYGRFLAAFYEDGSVIAVDAKGAIVAEGYSRSAFTSSKSATLNCLRGFGCDDKPEAGQMVRSHSASLFNIKEVDTMPATSQKGFCSLKIREDLMYNSILKSQTTARFAEAKQAEALATSTKTKIALLVPTTNKAIGAATNCALITSFLPSFIKSINPTEWDRFEFVLYLGYDDGDPILDTQNHEFYDAARKVIKDRNILIKYHKLPVSGWLTYIWNALFIDAYHDGCDYFYQLNDDITFGKHGWITYFVDTLERNYGLGVVGPSDRLWQCSLLTQSFVSKKHYQLFHWFYPIAIKDWFSDNWISSVYGKTDTFCDKSFGIINGKNGERYVKCDRPPWKEAIIEGQRTIEHWKNKS